MLTEICAEIHNYFCKPEDIQSGTFAVSNGSIEPLSFLQDGQYFRIVGSVFNDGVWQYGAENQTLTDETFEGYIWPMSIPKAVLDLNDEIEAWITEYGDKVNSPFQSESFGGYSYVKTVAGSRKLMYSWQDQFGPKLKHWKKVSVF